MLIRYPGSKDRALDRIVKRLNLSERRICEPFAGTAAVTIHLMEHRMIDYAHLNDADPAIANLWSIVRDRPSDLNALIRGYRPKAEDFYTMKREQTADPLRLAFTTVVLHQISYSGLGRMAGSPIGGRDQKGDYKVGCRWYPRDLEREINTISYWMRHHVRHVEITCGDWSECPEWEWYTDPPYLVAGAGLYRNGTIDHQALADHLRSKPSPWLLSYDDDDDHTVRSMYKWARIVDDYQFETYLTTRTKHPEKRATRKKELLISSGHIPEPDPTLF